MRNRIVFALVLVVALSGCSWRTGKQEIKEIDGQQFVCSWTENDLSGNVSDYSCYPVQP